MKILNKLLRKASTKLGTKSITRVLMIALALLAALAIGTEYYQQNIVMLPEGVVFQGIDMSGQNRIQARKVVEGAVDRLASEEIQLIVSNDQGEKNVEMLPVSEMVGIYDVNRTLRKMFVLADEIEGLHGSSLQVEPILSVSDQALEGVKKRLAAYESEAIDARIVFQEGKGFVLKESKPGFRYSDTQSELMKKQFERALLSGPEFKIVEILLETVDPEIETVALLDVYAEVQAYAAKNIWWVADGIKKNFSINERPEILTIDIVNGVVDVDTDALGLYVKERADEFDRDKEVVVAGVPVEQDGGYLKAGYEGEFKNGRKMDREDLFQQLLAALRSDGQEIEIELLHELASPVLVTADGQELVLLDQGRSSYSLGNYEDRIFNVRFGLDKYDGVVIPQGAEFSFNQILGRVTYEAGWKPAAAIFGGGGVRKVPGGGLCQVSTTMYRAAVRTGLRITQRKPHSLDIDYYHKYGDGIDATIYPPIDLDLKFVNDTPGPIYIHAYTVDEAEEAFVDFYGVDDGRWVELEQTENRKYYLDQEITYSEDLAPGERLVTRHGRQGRYVEWSWKIHRADGTVEERVIETNYPAQPAQVRVGASGSSAG